MTSRSSTWLTVFMLPKNWLFEPVSLEDSDYPPAIWYPFRDSTIDLSKSASDEGIPTQDVTEDIERMPVQIM